MMKTIGKSIFASGFFALLSAIFIGFSFTINEYSLLAVEHDGLFPAEEGFDMGACTKGSEVEIRDFKIEGKPADAIPILTYHRIISEEDIENVHYIDGKVNSMIVYKEEFEKQMKYLHDNGFVTLTLKELHAYLEGDIEIPDNSVVLTFDDGFKDNYEVAYPIMKKYGFKATEFVVTGAVTKKRYSFQPELAQYLSEKEIEKGCDVFDYQSHTYSYHKRDESASKIGHGPHKKHPAYLVTKSHDEVYTDIKASIHNLNGENLGFAYPYGEYSPDTIRILKELGYKMAFTVKNEVATRSHHLYEIPRFQIYHKVNMEEFKNRVQQ